MNKIMNNEIFEILKHQGFVKDDKQTSELKECYIKFINSCLWVEVNWVNSANFLEIIVNNRAIDYKQELKRIYLQSYLKNVRLNYIFINRIIQDCVVEFIISILQKDISDNGKNY
jgi:hypothetical protein